MDVSSFMYPRPDDTVKTAERDGRCAVWMSATDMVLLTTEHADYARRMAEAWAEAADRLGAEGTRDSSLLAYGESITRTREAGEVS